MLLENPWNVLFLLGFGVYVGIRHFFAEKTKGEEKVVSQIDGLEKGLLAVVLIGALLLPLLYLATRWFSFADYRLPGAVPWIGVVVMVAALWLFWRSHSDLGKNWSISLEVRRDHELIKHGVYRAIRHPMYASIWLWSLAQALLLQNWLAGFAALATLAPLYFMRTPREEKLMCETFGDEYRQYMKETGRLFPRLGAKGQ